MERLEAFLEGFWRVLEASWELPGSIFCHFGQYAKIARNLGKQCFFYCFLWFRKDSGAWKTDKIEKNRFREAKIGYGRPKMRLREAPGAEKIEK